MVGFRIIALALGMWLALSGVRAGEDPWTSREYVDLFFRHYNGHVPLPHLREAKQRALFQHLTDMRNITRIMEAPSPDQEKLRQLQIILAMLGGFRADYNIAVIVGEPLEQELTLLQAYMLDVAAAVAGLMRKPDGAASAWATMLEGVIQSVGDRNRYSPAQSAMLAEAISRRYPAIAAVLTNEDRRRLRGQALKLDPGDGNITLRRAIANMQKGMMAAP